MRQRRADGSYVDSFFVAVIHAGLGETQRTFDELDRATAELSLMLLWLKVEPKFKSLRASPRFKDLLKKVNLD